MQPSKTMQQEGSPFRSPDSRALICPDYLLSGGPLEGRAGHSGKLLPYTLNPNAARISPGPGCPTSYNIILPARPPVAGRGGGGREGGHSMCLPGPGVETLCSQGC